MDMLELIEMVNEMCDDVICVVQMEELPPLDISLYDPDERPYVRPRCNAKEYATMVGKEEIIPFLFDKDIYGWEVKGWDVDRDWGERPRIRIDLYRFNCN